MAPTLDRKLSENVNTFPLLLLLSRCTHTVITPFYSFNARARTHQLSDGAFGIGLDSPEQQCDDLEGRGKDQSTCHAVYTCIHMRLRTVKSQNQRYAHASAWHIFKYFEDEVLNCRCNDIFIFLHSRRNLNSCV